MPIDKPAASVPPAGAAPHQQDETALAYYHKDQCEKRFPQMIMAPRPGLGPDAVPIWRPRVDGDRPHICTCGLDKALAASTPPRDEGLQGWQPIATAPKDGTRVLVLARAYGVTYFGYCRFESFDDGSAGWIGGSFASQPEGNYSAFLQPTLWMPLPPVLTPSSSGGEQP